MINFVDVRSSLLISNGLILLVDEFDQDKNVAFTHSLDLLNKNVEIINKLSASSAETIEEEKRKKMLIKEAKKARRALQKIKRLPKHMKNQAIESFENEYKSILEIEHKEALSIRKKFKKRNHHFALRRR